MAPRNTGVKEDQTKAGKEVAEQVGQVGGANGWVNDYSFRYSYGSCSSWWELA
jgi:hypothetical protein